MTQLYETFEEKGEEVIEAGQDKIEQKRLWDAVHNKWQTQRTK
jgi:hypothetical protein